MLTRPDVRVSADQDKRPVIIGCAVGAAVVAAVAAAAAAIFIGRRRRWLRDAKRAKTGSNFRSNELRQGHGSDSAAEVCCSRSLLSLFACLHVDGLLLVF